MQKGDCFKAAGDWLLNNHVEGALLVHGEVSGQNKCKGIRFAHGWIELNDIIVFDVANGHFHAYSKDNYYKIGGIVNLPGKLVKYNYEQAVEMMLKEEHYGPWELTCKL